MLTASHNPGGEDEDLGIKFNSSNGGPANESVTNRIYEESKKIKTYASAILAADIDLDVVAEHNLGRLEGNDFDFRVSIVDSCEDYIELMKSLFDFEQMKAFVSRADFSMCFDGMHGVSGPYATKIFRDILGVKEENLFRCNVLPDFGKGHPDPNLTYAADLV